MRDMISLSGIEFVSVRECTVDCNVNQHARATIKGLVAEDFAVSDLIQLQQQRNFVLSEIRDGKKEYKLIQGTPTNIELVEVGNVKELLIELASHSIYTDLDQHMRSFQNIKMSYSDVAKKLQDTNENLTLIVPERGNETIQSLLFQYKETNWEFCMRIASRLNTVLVPGYLLDEPYISIGMPARSAAATIDHDNFSVRKNLAELRSAKARGLSLGEGAVESYQYTSREIYQLCDQLIFNGRKLYVWAIHAELTGGAMEYTYTLKDKSGFCQPAYENKELVGVTVDASVEAVEKTMVQVKIKGDDISQDEYVWLPYATVYSSTNKVGMYFMPEQGDAVRLKFSSTNEADAYVESSEHKNQFENPDTKSIRSPYGQSIVFAPDSIEIAMGNSKMTMNEERVEITSPGSIALNAQQDVNIEGSGKISITGGRGVTLDHNDSFVSVQDNVEIVSPYVKIR